MTDNWGFVGAAYFLAAAVLGAYWRQLVRRERELQRPESAAPEPRAPRASHPRPEPTSRPPLQ